MAQLQKKSTGTPGHQNHTVVTADPSAKQAGYLSDPAKFNREILFMFPYSDASLTQRQGESCLLAAH